MRYDILLRNDMVGGNFNAITFAYRCFHEF